jgi:uncharacterized protein YrzB (UPF0473 family)
MSEHTHGHDCDCGCNEEVVTVTLTLDNDEEIECAVLTIYEVDGKEYIALLPVDEEGQANEDGEVYLYRYIETEDGEPTLENIEDDDEYEAVADAFDEMLDELEFEDMIEE